MNKGKRPWEIGCPHCNFNEWQKKVEDEKKNGPGKETAVKTKESEKSTGKPKFRKNPKSLNKKNTTKE